MVLASIGLVRGFFLLICAAYTHMRIMSQQAASEGFSELARTLRFAGASSHLGP